jgi:hypothetical protein
VRKDILHSFYHEISRICLFKFSANNSKKRFFSKNHNNIFSLSFCLFILRISNLTYVSTDIQITKTNLTLNQCGCYLFYQNYSGLNYFISNQTCQLFANFVNHFILIENSQMLFCFINQPIGNIYKIIPLMIFSSNRISPPLLYARIV